MDVEPRHTVFVIVRVSVSPPDCELREGRDCLVRSLYPPCLERNKCSPCV